MNKTKKAIFMGAIDVFSKSGYEKSTMDEVAKAAGVAKGTLYYHFKSKEELFYFVVQTGIDLVKEDIVKTADSIEDPMDKVKAISRLELQYVYDNKDLFRVIISHLWGKNEQHKEIREQIGSLIKLNSNIIEKNGIYSDKEKEDHEIFGYYFIGVLFSAVLYEIVNGETDERMKVMNRFLEYITYEVKGKE